MIALQLLGSMKDDQLPGNASHHKPSLQTWVSQEKKMICCFEQDMILGKMFLTKMLGAT